MTKTSRLDSLSGRNRQLGRLLLPIAEDDSIEFDALSEEIDILIEAGVDGIYSNGTAGEFHNQTEAEFDGIQALLAERCGQPARNFVIGACQPDPAIVLARPRAHGARARPFRSSCRTGGRSPRQRPSIF